ncbi:MAG: CDGSH iron-sulfur domain-containing protein [Nitrospira sp.]|jgi:CDGSH-type Zn-finger protein|nr:CDGSH iron-sulfur domain-containing protein [Nitrospira sp.]
MSKQKKITVAKNGPYLVSGSVPLVFQTIGVNSDGESSEWVEGDAIPTSAEYALCRCGASKKKPFCDGTHAKIGFDGTETASRKPVMQQATVIDGPTMQLADAEDLCAFGRFCDPHGRVWNQVKDTDDAGLRAQFVRQVGDCPAGRLMAIDKETGKSIEPTLPQSIGVVEDPALKCSGPLWVRGGIELIDADGQAYEIRNRMTLCRCGRSENKPFCNGAHAADPKFRDGLR